MKNFFQAKQNSQALWDQIKIGNLPAVEKLVQENKAIVNALDNKGNNSLYYAYKSKAPNSEGLKNYLLHFGADANIKNKNNQTPEEQVKLDSKPVYSSLGIFRKSPEYQVREVQIKQFSYLFEQRPNAKNHPNYSFTEYLAILDNCLSNIDEGARRKALNMGEAHSNPPLHIVAKEGNLELVKLLVKHGANIAAKNGSGRTAEQEARRNSLKLLSRISNFIGVSNYPDARITADYLRSERKRLVEAVVVVNDLVRSNEVNSDMQDQSPALEIRKKPVGAWVENFDEGKIKNNNQSRSNKIHPLDYVTIIEHVNSSKDATVISSSNIAADPTPKNSSKNQQRNI